MTETETHV